MQKILSRTRVIMRKVHRILKIRRRRRRKWLLRMLLKLMTPKRALTATKQAIPTTLPLLRLKIPANIARIQMCTKH